MHDEPPGEYRDPQMRPESYKNPPRTRYILELRVVSNWLVGITVAVQWLAGLFFYYQVSGILFRQSVVSVWMISKQPWGNSCLFL